MLSTLDYCENIKRRTVEQSNTPCRSDMDRYQELLRCVIDEEYESFPWVGIPIHYWYRVSNKKPQQQSVTGTSELLSKFPPLLAIYSERDLDGTFTFLVSVV